MVTNYLKVRFPGNVRALHYDEDEETRVPGAPTRRCDVFPFDDADMRSAARAMAAARHHAGRTGVMAVWRRALELPPSFDNVRVISDPLPDAEAEARARAEFLRTALQVTSGLP
jgi:hypothetical protein